jgi:hypothetical protein
MIPTRQFVNFPFTIKTNPKRRGIIKEQNDLFALKGKRHDVKAVF